MHRDRHYHEYSVSVDVTDTRHNYGRASQTHEDDLADALRSFMCWAYRLLGREYDYLTSEEAIVEAIEVNACEFDEHGNLA